MGSKNVVIIAGEASGDLHGAHLVKCMKEIDPTVGLHGIGGGFLKSAGVDILFDSRDLAVVGFSEVIFSLARIIRAFRYVKHLLKVQRPDLLILIDYPDFNLLLARVARKCGIPVMYYISPQLWAWRKGRVRKISRFVDKMVVIFPFEVPFYKNHNIKVEFVGHPLVDIVRPRLSKQEAIKRFGLKGHRATIALLPGSRTSEIRKILPILLGAAKILKDALPDPQFILPVAPTISKNHIESLIGNNSIGITISQGYIYDVMNISDLIITASGTATLEAAIMNTPMVVVYKVSALSYLIGKLLIRVDHIGMVNLVAGERVVPELIQNDAQPNRIAHECLRILEDPRLTNTIKGKLNEVKNKLGQGGASRRAAHIAYNMMNKDYS